MQTTLFCVMLHVLQPKRNEMVGVASTIDPNPIRTVGLLEIPEIPFAFSYLFFLYVRLFLRNLVTMKRARYAGHAPF
jgi:hypothetical protein